MPDDPKPTDATPDAEPKMAEGGEILEPDQVIFDAAETAFMIVASDDEAAGGK